MTDSPGAINTTHSKTKAKKATGAAIFGTFIEYYDFSVYGYVAATLAVVFFPQGDPVVGVLNTLLVFASAFLVRPIGAWFFGRMGDRHGRRLSLIASITLMGAAAFLTGVLPGYAQIGVFAPILLVIMRMLQGFSAGGEIGGAASYIREWAPEKRRSLYISFIPAVANLGKGLAAGAAGLGALLTPDHALETWAWRIPFFLALPLAVIALYMRLKVEDSPEFTDLANKEDSDDREPFKELLRDYRSQALKVIGIATVQTAGTYVGTVFIAVYFSTVLGFTEGQSSTIVLIGVLFAACLIPIAGQLGNRMGPKRTLVTAYIAYVVITLPSFLLMNGGLVWVAVIGLAIGMIPYALCQAGTYASIAEFYPTRIRHTGVSVGHSVGSVIGGGGAPYLSTWLIDVTGNSFMPAYLLILAGAVGLVIVSTTKRNDDLSSHLFK